MVAGGVLLGLFTAWLYWGTSPQPTAQQRAAVQKIQASWRQGAVVPSGAIALIRIPALGRGWEYPVYPGIDTADLAHGLGHYPTTAGPGRPGNFALAGHRSSDTGFEPLAELPDKVRPGDPVIVDTPTAEYTYTVDADKRTTPEDTAVLAPGQGRGANPSGGLLTITTCTPRYGSSGRYILFGHLSGRRIESVIPPAPAQVRTPAAGGAAVAGKDAAAPAHPAAPARPAPPAHPHGGPAPHPHAAAPAHAAAAPKSPPSRSTSADAAHAQRAATAPAHAPVPAHAPAAGEARTPRPTVPKGTHA